MPFLTPTPAIGDFILSLAAVLRIGNLLHPVDGRAVELLLDRDMAHGRGWPRAVPVLFAGLKPHNVAGPDFLDRTAFALHPAKPRHHDQRLAERVRVPGRTRAGLEGDKRPGNPGGLRRAEQRIDANRAGEP